MELFLCPQNSTTDKSQTNGPRLQSRKMESHQEVTSDNPGNAQPRDGILTRWGSETRMQQMTARDNVGLWAMCCGTSGSLCQRSLPIIKTASLSTDEERDEITLSVLTSRCLFPDSLLMFASFWLARPWHPFLLGQSSSHSNLVNN
jgi:hypothetical protein